MTDTAPESATTDTAPAKPRRTQAQRAADDLGAARRRLVRLDDRILDLEESLDAARDDRATATARVDYLAANPLLA